LLSCLALHSRQYQGHHLIKDEKTIAVLTAAQKSADCYVGLFLRRLDKSGKLSAAPDIEPLELFPTDSLTSVEDIYKVGVFAQVRQINRVATGAQLFITGLRRINIGGVDRFGPPAVATVEHWATQRMAPLTQEVKAYTNELLYASRYVLIYLLLLDLI
jgi:ATP-dependent Lon protease